MDELNLLAQSVWKRVARGEAYSMKPPARKPKPVQNDLRPLFLLLVIVLAAKR